MNLKIAIIGAALVSSAAFAAAPTLNCPAGTTQQMTRAKDAYGCFAPGAHEQAVTQGPVVTLHPNGMKSAEGQQAGNFRVGTWTFFNEQGVKTHTAELARGQWNGTTTFFYSTGKVQKIEQYSDGKFVALLKEFDASGKVIATTAAK